MKREFVINRHGKDYVLYAGLLDEAHQQGLRAIKTQLLQTPSPQNGQVAICLAEVTTDKGTFTGLGDAEPGNVNRAMANALIRLAETRAKARALRDAVNVGMIAIEELSEGAPDALPVDEEALSAYDPAGAGAAGVPPASPTTAGPNGASGPGTIVSLSSVRQQAQQVQQAQQAQQVQQAHPAEPGHQAVSGRPARPRPVALSGADAEPDVAPVAPAAAAPARGPMRVSATRSSGSDGPPLPATQTQLETIAKLARGAGRAVATEGLTRAAASELITRLSEERYGARRPSS